MNCPSIADIVFTTERMIARRLGLGDVEALLSVYGDAEAMRWVGDGRPITRAECEQWIDVTLRNYAQRGYGMFALEERTGPGIVGFCGIVHPGGQTDPEIKYAFLRSHWRRGLATEAAVNLLAYGRRVHRLQYIIATTAPENLASHKVLLKAGMQREALRINEGGSKTQVFSWSSVENAV
jgi:ribosomal-protein-alanine N-acetyltransferase